jgi:hypothetical protein
MGMGTVWMAGASDVRGYSQGGGRGVRMGMPTRVWLAGIAFARHVLIIVIILFYSYIFYSHFFNYHWIWEGGHCIQKAHVRKRHFSHT